MEQKIIKRINFPSWRYEIEGALENLSDYKMQHEKWPKNSLKYPHSYWDSLMLYALDVLYNDCQLHEYKESNIGEIFYNEEEANKVFEFCYWLDELTITIGEYKPDSAYLEHPEWHKVYSGAKECYELMDKNSKKYNLSACLDEFNNTPFEEWEKKFRDE